MVRTGLVASLFAPAFAYALPRFAPRQNQAVVSIGNDGLHYYADVMVGAQQFDLLVDTGSPNTWINANVKYVPTSGATNLHRAFEVQYGSSASVNGTLWTDKFTAIATTAVAQQSIGVAEQVDGFPTQNAIKMAVDGALGLAPTSQDSDTTWLDNLAAQHAIPANVVGVYFNPLPTDGSFQFNRNGLLTVGWILDETYTGNITYVDALKDETGKIAAWVAPVDSLSTDGTPLPDSGLGALVDTSVPGIVVPSTPYNAWLVAANGTYTQNLTSFETTPTASFDFEIGGTTFGLTPDQYLIPKPFYALWNIPANSTASWSFITKTGDDDFIIGQKFIEQYLTILDSDNARIGFAVANHNLG